MLARSPERRKTVPEKTPLPGSSKGTTQKRKADLVKARAPLRRFITRLHVNLIELINQEGSRSFLKKKMLEWEQSWEQCRKLDQLVLNMISEQEGEEAEKKEEDVQYEYEVKMEELREASKIYLEKRIMEPPSLAGSVAGSVIDPDINIGERNRIPEDENRGEMDLLQTYLESGNRTRFLENGHVPRVPFPCATSTGHRAENPPSTYEWFRRRPASREREFTTTEIGTIRRRLYTVVQICIRLQGVDT